MRRRDFIKVIVGSNTWPLAGRAQQPAKIYRIGNLTPGPVAPRLQNYTALREGLRELGYVEGQHYVVELRSAEGQYDKLPDLAAELVRLDVDVIIAATERAVRAAKESTNQIPIVMISVSDPISAGFIVSLARPGGNITGLTNVAPDISGKRLELLREIVPGISRVAVIMSSLTDTGYKLQLRGLELAARNLGIQLLTLEVRRPDDFESAFQTARAGASGLIVQNDVFLFSSRARIVELAATYRLPAIYGDREFADIGGLVAFGTSLIYQWHRAATYVDKILKGVKAADLPVEQPTRFDLIVNRKTAETLGIAIPPSMLIRADQVIE